MPGDKPFDVKSAIEQSASKTTIQELARKGIHRVKVLDEAAIQRLIDEAVRRILSTRTNALSDEERERVFQQSRQELDRLMKEHQTLKTQADLVTTDKAGLIREAENLQEQLRLQRKMADELARQRYDEGRAATKQLADEQIQALKERMGSLEAEVTQRVRNELELTYSKKTAEGTKNQYEELTRLKEQLAEKVQQVANATASKEAMERESVDLRRRADEALQKEREAQERLTKAHEDSRKNDELLFTRMESLFTKSIDSLNKKLTDLRLRSIAGGGGMGVGVPGMGGGGEEFRLSATSIENLFKQELESNLKGLESEETKSGGQISSALERLKKLREGNKGDTKEQK